MTHPFQLTPEEATAVRNLYSSSFPNPTLRQAARSTDWGPIGGRDDDYYKPHERRCQAAMNSLIAKGLCEEHNGRFYRTPLTEAYRAYEERGRLLTAALGNLDRLAFAAAEVHRAIESYRIRLEEAVNCAR